MEEPTKDSKESESGNDHADHIVILATSDMHGNVVSFSYEDNEETSNNGMARLYTYILKTRSEEPAPCRDY